MTTTDTTGKTVTIASGHVLTDVGPWVNADGAIMRHTRRCVDNAGNAHAILDRVVQELPVTHRRAEMEPIHRGEWPKEWHSDAVRCSC